MFTRCLRYLAPRLLRCEIQNSSNSVSFTISDSVTHSNSETLINVCREWVIDNDVARRHITGQKSTNIYDDPALLATQVGKTAPFTSALISACGERIHFSTEFGKSHEIIIRVSDVLKYLYGKQRVAPLKHLEGAHHMHRTTYTNFLDTDSAANAESLVRLAKDGVILVRGCPIDNDDAIRFLARAVDLEMPTLYGTTFRVVTAPSEGPKNNVAYSSVGLDLHQDLAYHESMPGLQFLLCQKFDERCTGGESTFLDLHYAAERLKEKHPAAFKSLCEIPAAFMKDDWDRPIPAQYYYATPHIHVNDLGDVTKCFWAPPFEAPVPPTPRMAEYYEARRAFQSIIFDMSKTSLLVEFRLQPGDCVIFHQARMLHGRREFTEPEPCSRQLHGTYVNVDAFRNATVTRAAKHKIAINDIPGFANRSFR
jgi:alpha-ketoglutarate-dependent taurine dioxygenase